MDESHQEEFLSQLKELTRRERAIRDELEALGSRYFDEGRRIMTLELRDALLELNTAGRETSRAVLALVNRVLQAA